jgi:hypothetical protein
MAGMIFPGEGSMNRLIGICVVVALLMFAVNAQKGARKSAPKGTLRHIAAFNFKPDVPQELIDKIIAEARATLPTIKGVSNVVIGPQTSNWTKFRYAMSLDLVNREAKADYANSPQSKRLHEQFKQYVEDEIIVDILNE